MKHKQIVLSLLTLAALMALPVWGIPIEIDTADFMSAVGVRFGTTKIEMAEGQTLTATVALPAVLARNGLKAAKEGDAVQVTFIRDHRFKLMHVPSGASVEFTYRPKK